MSGRLLKSEGFVIIATNLYLLISIYIYISI